jgi:hypothetical protein
VNPGDGFQMGRGTKVLVAELNRYSNTSVSPALAVKYWMLVSDAAMPLYVPPSPNGLCFMWRLSECAMGRTSVVSYP